MWRSRRARPNTEIVYTSKYPAYWELCDTLRDATTTKKALFYLYACNLARIAGFKELSPRGSVGRCSARRT